MLALFSTCLRRTCGRSHVWFWKVFPIYLTLCLLLFIELVTWFGREKKSWLSKSLQHVDVSALFYLLLDFWIFTVNWTRSEWSKEWNYQIKSLFEWNPTKTQRKLYRVLCYRIPAIARKSFVLGNNSISSSVEFSLFQVFQSVLMPKIPILMSVGTLILMLRLDKTFWKPMEISWNLARDVLLLVRWGILLLRS